MPPVGHSARLLGAGRRFGKIGEAHVGLTASQIRDGLDAVAAQEPQPELHIRGDKAVRYERVALAMAAAQKAGVRKIGFITEPAP